jgi:hypothetical protein
MNLCSMGPYPASGRHSTFPPCALRISPRILALQAPVVSRSMRDQLN